MKEQPNVLFLIIIAVFSDSIVNEIKNNLLKNAIINDSKEKNIEMPELDSLEIKEDDPPIIEEMEIIMQTRFL